MNKKPAKNPAVCPSAGRSSGSYTAMVMEHFKKPHNYGRMKDPDAVGKVGNIVCGDVMWLYIKVAKNKTGKEIIKDIKFETFGCVAAIATSSVITDIAKGMELEAAAKINKQTIVDQLGGLPPIKLHCSVLAADALAEAIYDYYAKKKRTIPKELKERHQRIKKERDIIEEKYKEWTSTEEKMRN
jgi:nitrogen fixation NifU-like protein